jgi:capsular exopolysaccharide synthesis family protein
MKDEGVALSEILRQRPNTAFAESFRMIRSSVMLSSSKETPRKILITSSVQGEGKSSVCLNLAQTIAKDGKSVIVLDCDLRRPTQHKLLNIDNRIGMSTYLAGLSKENVIVSIPDYNISVIPSGPLPPDPAELLGSAKMYRILEVLSRNYEFILIDSAPILSVTDSHVLSTMVDATMLVTQANKTTYDLVKASVKLLKKLNAHLLGSVLNAKVMKKKGYAAYNYGEYYTDDYLSPSSRSDQNKFS